MGGTRMFRRATTVAVLATLLLVPLLAVIGPVGAQTGSSAPRGWVDRIQAVNGGIDIAGWAVDMDRPSDAVTVHVYANGGYVDGRRAAANRPDVNAALGVTGGHGFGWTIPAGPGTYEICVYALGLSSGGGLDGVNPRLGCRTVAVGGGSGGGGTVAPRGHLDRVVGSGRGVELAGWAVDMDHPSDAVTVHVYANGGYVDGRRASANRPDVNAALGVTGGHGFGWTVPLGAGFWDVCVYAIGVGGGGDTNLGCRSVTIGGAAATDVQSRLRQLGYWHTDQPGNFGAGTEHALTALQKVAGIPRTGVVDEPTRKALADGVRPAARSSQGRVIEVDLARQVLMVVVNGRVETILDTATGKASTPTPPGAFEVYRAVDAWDPGPYGSLYRPRYFVGGVAVHGFGSVPEQPASHGCVRVTLEAMDWIWANNVMPLGTDVWVY